MLQGRRRYLFGLRASAAVAVLLLAGSPAGADTLEQALVQAYQNNPQLNAQRASTRAIDENVSIALGGYRPRVTATSSLSEVYLENVARAPEADSATRLPARMRSRPLVLPATQTLFNGFQTGNRTRQAEVAGACGARNTAQHRADGAAERGHGLHEPAARHRHSRAPAQQRQRARSDAATDARPLQRRRGDAHRRGAGRVASGRRALAAADGANPTTRHRRRTIGR